MCAYLKSSHQRERGDADNAITWMLLTLPVSVVSRSIFVVYHTCKLPCLSDTPALRSVSGNDEQVLAEPSKYSRVDYLPVLRRGLDAKPPR